MRFLIKVMLGTMITQMSIAVSNIELTKTFRFSEANASKSSNKNPVKNPNIPHYRIAILTPAWDSTIDSIINGFQDTLNNQNLFTASFKRYNPNGDRVLLRSQAEDIFMTHYDLIYSIGMEPTKILKEISQHRNDNTSIVFSNINNPIPLGIVKSLEKPDANITGIFGNSMIPLYGNLILTLFKKLKTVLIVYNPTSQGGVTAQQKEDLQQLLEARGIQVKSVEVFKVEDIVQRTEHYLDGVNLLLSVPDSTTYTGVKHLVKLSDRHAIPLMTPLLDAVKKGVTVTLGVSGYAVGALVAQRAYQILAEGKAPRDIPISDIGLKWNLLINTKAAERQGLTLDKNMNFLLRHAHVVGKKGKA